MGAAGGAFVASTRRWRFSRLRRRFTDPAELEPEILYVGGQRSLDAVAEIGTKSLDTQVSGG